MIGYRLAAALAVATLAVPAFAQVKKVDVQGVQNFNQIDAVFACGGATGRDRRREPEEAGIRVDHQLPPSHRAGRERRRSRHQDDGNQIRASAAQRRRCPIRKSPTNSWRPYPTRAISRPTSTAAAAGAASMWMIKRAIKDGWTTDRAAEEANAIAMLSPALKTFATNYIAAHK